MITTRHSNNFVYQFPIQNDAEIPVEISGRSPAECPIKRPVLLCCSHYSRNQCNETCNKTRGTVNKIIINAYGTMSAFLTTIMDSNYDVPVSTEKLIIIAGTPVSTLLHGGGDFSTEIEVEFYDEKKNVHTISGKLT